MRDKGPVTVDIVDLSVDGYGDAEDSHIAVFGALPGERVVARPFTRKRKKLYARTISVERASADRVEPICGAAGYCGGCSLQHLDTAAQLRFKRSRLRDLLAGGEPREWLPPLTGPVREYRTKARLGVRYVEKKGRLLVGFREKMSPYIAEIDQCEVLARPLGGLIPSLSRLIGSMDACTRIPQIEVAVGEEGAALVFRHLDPLGDADLARLEAFSAEHGIATYLQPGNPASVTKLSPRDGMERLHYSLPAFDLTFEFHPLDFTQVNQTINEKLVDLSLALLEPARHERILDLFCGIGNFSLPLARRASEVVGIELAESSVARARDNARHNHIDNCTFITGDLTGDSSQWKWPRGTFDKALLDPPRSGAMDVCEKLASHKVKRVVYVSCNPVTLARDARVLVESGYRLDKAGVVDMFPHTTHVESIACFLRQDV